MLLPCGNVSNLQNAGSQHSHNADTGFAYLEGFDDANVNFDVGFQYSADGSNWAPYYARGSGEVLIGTNVRFACGYSVTMKFSTIDYPYKASMISSIVSGTIGSAVKSYTTLFTPTASWSGALDSSARVARMTTIAQGQDSFADGAYFGLTNGAPTAAVIQWSKSSINGCEVDTSGEVSPQIARREVCTNYNWASEKASYQNYPSTSGNPATDADSSSNGNKYEVVTNLVSDGQENDGIRFPSPSPPPGGGGDGF